MDRTRGSATVRLIAPGLGLVSILLVWQLLSHLIDSVLVLPTPFQTLVSFLERLRSSGFYLHLLATFVRAALGFVLSLVTGLLWGLLAGLSPAARRFLLPAVVLIRSTPVIAVILLAIIWFAPTRAPVLVTWLMVMPVVEQTVEYGVRNTEFRLLEMAKVFRVPQRRIVRDVHLPALRPFVRGSFHAGLGMAYKVAVAAEVLVQPPWGLGASMQEARYYLDSPRIMSLTVAVVILGGITEAVLRLIDRIHDQRARRDGLPTADVLAEPHEPPSLAGSGVQPARLPVKTAGAVRLVDVGKAFESVPVFAHLSLEAQSKRITVVLGPSGCGKTTLLRAVAGLTDLDAGSIETPAGPASAIVFQEPRVLPWRSCVENVSFVMPHPDANLAELWLSRAGLLPYAHAKPIVLSGGMVQRLTLARAFAADSPVVLMDEPFQNLDVKTKIQLAVRTRELHGSRESATLYVTHDVMEAALVGDTIVILSSRPARVLSVLDVPLDPDERDPRHPAAQRFAGDLYEVLLSSRQR